MASVSLVPLNMRMTMLNLAEVDEEGDSLLLTEGDEEDTL